VELFLLALIVILELIGICVMLFIFISLLVSLLWGSPYMGIQRRTLKQILSFGGISKDDIFYDLGAGDARVVIAAKKYFDVKKAVGYEISPWPFLKGSFLIRRAKLHNVVVFERRNIFNTNISDATFVYLYLYTSFINEKIAPKLVCELKIGTKILSCSSQIDLSKYPMFELMRSDYIGNIHIYLYRKIY
jgi:hypothetical protein